MLVELLNGDSNFQLMLDFLVESFEDLYQLSATHPLFFEAIVRFRRLHKLSGQRMKSLLEDKKIPMSKFFKFLRKNKAVISGSFALQTLIHPSKMSLYKNSDIDVYVHNDCNYPKIVAFLESYEYESTPEQNTVVFDYGNSVAALSIEHVETFKNTAGEKIQIIRMVEGKQTRECSNLFDMTMCQVMLIQDPKESEGVRCVVKHTGDVANHVLRLNPANISALKGIMGWVYPHGYTVPMGDDVGDVEDTLYPTKRVLNTRVRKVYKTFFNLLLLFNSTFFILLYFVHELI